MYVCIANYVASYSIWKEIIMVIILPGYPADDSITQLHLSELCSESTSQPDMVCLIVTKILKTE